MILKDIKNIRYADLERTSVNADVLTDSYGLIPTRINLEKPENLHTILVNGVEIGIEEYCKTLQILPFEEDISTIKNAMLSNLLVTVNEMTFDGDLKSRNNMAAAIHYMELFSLTDIDWKLADNSVKKISIAELKMALALAIKKVGSIITSKTVTELKEL